MWAVLELTSHGWRGVVMTPRSVAEIGRLHRRQQQLSTEVAYRRLPVHAWAERPAGA